MVFIIFRNYLDLFYLADSKEYLAVAKSINQGFT